MLKQWQKDLDYARLVGPDELLFRQAIKRVNDHIDQLEQDHKASIEACIRWKTKAIAEAQAALYLKAGIDQALADMKDIRKQL